MTIVCWDGKTLAADQRVTYGSTIGTARKIFALRKQRLLVGISGNHAPAMELVEWLRSGAAPSEFPSSCRDDETGAFALVINISGKALLYTTGPYPLEVCEQHAAIGNADEGALIAMHLGKTAVEAVQIVSLFNNTCGNGYDALTLDDLA